MKERHERKLKMRGRTIETVVMVERKKKERKRSINEGGTRREVKDKEKGKVGEKEIQNAKRK